MSKPEPLVCTPTNDEHSLLCKVQKGDEAAFRLLFDRYKKQIYSYALKIVKSESYAEEILHDVFIRIWQHENPAEIENLTYYLRTLTRNITFNILRRIKLELKVNDDRSHYWEETHNDTENTVILNDATQMLNQAISLLPPQQKLVYTLCREEGLKYAQVAERLCISPLTVKTHMQQALRFLRSYVNKHSDMTMLLVLFQILCEKK